MIENVRSTFTPGEAWLDTDGTPIHAHGGSIIRVGETFYWYGEDKEHTDGHNGVWHSGMRMYSSTDLLNWSDRGAFIPSVEDPDSPMHSARLNDRPHILHCADTGKFVCWIKVMGERTQTRLVFSADVITGPYELIATDVRPLGMNAGDFDLVVSPDDAKAYMVFERVHTEMIVADLTDDYTGVTGYYSTHLCRPGPPATREAPAYFRRGTKHYLASSGTTCYFPNPSEIAVADTYHGPWTTLGTLHRNDTSSSSFNSQISSVFRHPAKRDLYIALADRWNGTIDDPTFDSGELSSRVHDAFERAFTGPTSTAEDAVVMKRWGGIDINTSLARHVWLPIRFEDDRPFIEWRDEWSLDEFEDR